MPCSLSFFAEVGEAYARVKTSKEMLFIFYSTSIVFRRGCVGLFLSFSRLIERGRIIKYLYHKRMLDKRGVVNVKQGARNTRL